MSISRLGHRIDQVSDQLVDAARLLRDQGKQPAEILAELLDLYGEEPPEEPEPLEPEPRHRAALTAAQVEAIDRQRANWWHAPRHRHYLAEAWLAVHRDRGHRLDAAVLGHGARL